MNVVRTFEGINTFAQLFIPLIYSEIDRLIEQEADFHYNENNANTSHSEGVA
jgi:hypothetical protein